MSYSLLVPPYGGKLIDLVVPEDERDELWARANRLPSIQISERTAGDLQLLACGSFSPLDRFVGKADHQRILGGELENLTGLDDPYEPPEQPEFVLDTVSKSAEENAGLILGGLVERGFVLRH
jgi:hypothetical protein